MEGITLYKPRFPEIKPKADGEFYVICTDFWRILEGVKRIDMIQ